MAPEDLDTPDRYWMRKAIELAWENEGRTRPNPPVGALIVCDGRLVAQGAHRKAGGPHAEVAALRRAGDRARGADMYVTLEPCCTTGRTPPCTQAVIEAGIRRIVSACSDPNPAHSGKGLSILKKSGLIVKEDVCSDEAARLIEPFRKWILEGLPFVSLKMAMTLDGRISDKNRRSKWISGVSSRKLVADLRRRCDAVLVGVNTALIDDPGLLPGGQYNRTSKFRIIVDSKGSLPLNAGVLNDGYASQTIMAVTGLCPDKKIAKYEKKGARVWKMPSRKSMVSQKSLFRRLGDEGFLHVLCEGGGRIAGSLIEADLVDRYLFFVAPRIAGGEKSTSVVQNTGWPLDKMPRL